MEPRNLNEDAKELATLTYNLFMDSQTKELKIAQFYNLTLAEFRCLKHFNPNEVLNNKEIADKMSLSPSRLTRIIDGLVKKELLTRELNTEDRRNMKVLLSEKGIKMRSQMNETYLNIHKNILASIDPAQHKEVINALKIMVASLEKWIAGGYMLLLFIQIYFNPA